MKVRLLLVISIIITCSTPILCNNKVEIFFSPFLFGLKDAKTDQERYEILFNTHKYAVEKGAVVDYSGIEELHIEVPKNALPIPLTEYTDFKGIRLYVTNCSKDLYIFSRVHKPKVIDITKEEFGSGNYIHRSELQLGTNLLVVEDMTPWVENRLGYSYRTIRKDLLLISGGKVHNRPIHSYGTVLSNPNFSYIHLKNEGGCVKNLNFYRTEVSTYKSFLFQLGGQDGYKIENINIYTPESKQYGDAAISISNCANTMLVGVCIHGTYSLNNKYGYGISLDNVWNTTVENIQSESKWGVFGNNNVNKCTLKNCYINRFDIHCYGRDIYMEDCYFKGLYNQYSSVFGTISHKRCTFENAKPVLIESSYNAYTGFDVVFEDCAFKMNKKKRELIYLMSVPEIVNNRPELSEKCLPNVQVNNCSFDFEDGMKEWYVFRAENKSLNIPLGYISLIDMRRIKLSNRVNCKISNIDLHSIRKVKYNIKSWKTLHGLDFKNGIVKNLNRQVVN